MLLWRTSLIRVHWERGSIEVVWMECDFVITWRGYHEIISVWTEIHITNMSLYVTNDVNNEELENSVTMYKREVICGNVKYVGRYFL